MLLPDERFPILFSGEAHAELSDRMFNLLLTRCYYTFALKLSAARPDIGGRVRAKIDAENAALGKAGSVAMTGEQEMQALEAELQPADSEWAVPLLVAAVTEAQTGLRPSVPWA